MPQSGISTCSHTLAWVRTTKVSPKPPQKSLHEKARHTKCVAAPFGGKTHKRGVQRSPPTMYAERLTVRRGNAQTGYAQICRDGRPRPSVIPDAQPATHKPVGDVVLALRRARDTLRGHKSSASRIPDAQPSTHKFVCDGASSPVTLRVPPSRDRREAECRRARITLCVGEDNPHWGGTNNVFAFFNRR